mgnify:CR=1 FL=1
MKWEVAVIGGGAIGAAVAYELGARARLGVTVIDDPTASGAASRAAGGVLVAGGIDARPGFWFSVRRHSARLFAEWVHEVSRRAGWEISYRRGCVFHLAQSSNEATRWRAVVAERAPVSGACRWIDANELKEAEPGVADSVVGAAWFAEDALVDPRALLGGLRRAAQAGGVNWREDRVAALVPETKGVRILCRSGDEVEAEQVVVAAGAGSRDLLAPLGIRLPLVGVRGEMARLRSSRQGEPVAFAAPQGVVQLRCEQLWVGGNKEKTLDPAHVSASGLAALLELARQNCRRHVVGYMLEVRAGLRPCSTVRHPLLGRPKGAEWVLVATGHHRSGILLAPVTALLVRQTILGQEPAVPLAAFAW